jgi:hypothetical protein
MRTHIAVREQTSDLIFLIFLIFLHLKNAGIRERSLVSAEAEVD